MKSIYEDLIKKYPVKTILYDDKIFPQSLKELKDCPKEIYLIGNENILNKDAISIVGTRHSSSYGNELSYSFANILSKNGLIVVSGLAFGIDQNAHDGAAEYGNTIAILGGGFNNSINSGNYKIVKKILEYGGAILTEYKADIPPRGFTFLARNRLIAAFSKATIVIEAPIKSGALNTARHAYDLNKELYAVPWSLNYSKGAGCNNLLINMAIPLINITQILSAFLNTQYTLFDDNLLENMSIPKEYLPLYNYIKENGPLNCDQIYNHFDHENVSKLSSILTIMEINSYINLKDGLYFV